jgi:hypothetical protein
MVKLEQDISNSYPSLYLVTDTDVSVHLNLMMEMFGEKVCNALECNQSA